MVLSSAGFNAPSRPASSLSRPSSSASHYAPSRLSHRPDSRRSFRHKATSRVLIYAQKLVTQLTGVSIESDEAKFYATVDRVLKNVDIVTKQGVGQDMGTIHKHLNGFSEKARINCFDEYADALDLVNGRLKSWVDEGTSDLDQDIQTSKLPSHLQLLILLSVLPTGATHSYADQVLDRERNPPPPSPRLTWEEILADEPFEGQHWEGVYGLPPGSTVEGWERADSDPDSMSPYMSPLKKTEELELDSVSSWESDGEISTLNTTPEIPQVDMAGANKKLYFNREVVETLQAKQYWREGRPETTEILPKFDIQDPSTLHSALEIANQRGLLRLRESQTRYITEQAMVREVLLALQGFESVVFKDVCDPEGRKTAVNLVPDVPQVKHLSSISLASILTSFAHTCTHLGQLRVFCKSMLSYVPTPTSGAANMRTLQAFSEAVLAQIHKLDSWCADQTSRLFGTGKANKADTIISLLSLENTILTTFSETYLCLSQTVDSVVAKVPNAPSYDLSTMVLDYLFHECQLRQSTGDVLTAHNLTEVLCRTAQPIWQMMGSWLETGESTELVVPPGQQWILNDEFFIRAHGHSIADSRFWTAQYTTKEDNDGEHLPGLFQTVAAPLLSAGKSVGLLRSLQRTSTIGSDIDYLRRGRSWPLFGDFVEAISALLTVDTGPSRNHSASPNSAVTTKHPYIALSSQNFTLLLADQLTLRCSAAESALKNIIFDQCGLVQSLHKFEDVYFMRKGDVLSHFCDILFSKVDSRQTWNEFHFLNVTFRDALQEGNIDGAFFRMSCRPIPGLSIFRTVRAFEGMSLAHSAPFPLMYVFDEKSSEGYNAVFVFLLQIRRARHLLERILMRTAESNGRSPEELKLWYAMRGRLSWFTGVLLDFITTHVIHSGLRAFHETLRKAQSFDDILSFHDKHLERIKRLCFLSSDTLALKRAITSILDLCIRFSDDFTSVAGDTTLDLTRRSRASRSHRSRRVRRERRDVVAFSPEYRRAGPYSQPESESDSDDDDLGLDIGNLSAIGTDSVHDGDLSTEDASPMSRFERSMLELDKLVHLVRRNVEHLANAGSDMASTFEIFAFMLQDWDQ